MKVTDAFWDDHTAVLEKITTFLPMTSTDMSVKLNGTKTIYTPLEALRQIHAMACRALGKEDEQ